MAAGTATLVGTLAARKPAQAEEVTMLPLSTIERITPPRRPPGHPRHRHGRHHQTPSCPTGKARSWS